MTVQRVASHFLTDQPYKYTLEPIRGKSHYRAGQKNENYL